MCVCVCVLQPACEKAFDLEWEGNNALTSLTKEQLKGLIWLEIVALHPEIAHIQLPETAVVPASSVTTTNENINTSSDASSTITNADSQKAMDVSL